MLQLDALRSITEGFLTYRPFESIRVQCFLLFKFDLTSIPTFYFLVGKNQDLDDAIDGYTRVRVDAPPDAHHYRIMSIVSYAKAIEGE